MANVPHNSVQAAAGQVAGFGASLSEAHRLNHRPGSEDEPWQRSFFELALPVFMDALPWVYLKSLAVRFEEVATEMEADAPASTILGHWTIVRRFLSNASSVLLACAPECVAVEAISFGTQPPSVLHFDKLARIVSEKGARTLEQAGLAVRRSDSLTDCPLCEDDLVLLQMLSRGLAIVDVATDLGVSLSTANRRLRKVRATIGAVNTVEALSIVSAQGWISPDSDLAAGWS